MASLKQARIVIAEERQHAQATLAATQRLASSPPIQSVTPAMRIAVRPHASLPRAARYVALAPGSAILRRSAAAPQHLALQIPQLQMARLPFPFFFHH